MTSRRCKKHHLFQVGKCLLQALFRSGRQKDSGLDSYSVFFFLLGLPSCERETSRADCACACVGTSHPAPVSSPL
jgi:hypothetical protein